MAHRRFLIVALLLCFCLCLAPRYALAANTADAKEPILTEKATSLTIAYRYDGTSFPNVSVKLYKIADVSADYQYTATPLFQSSGLILNGIQTNGEWDVIRSTLEAHILANGIAADATKKTDANGLVCFDSLTTGLYLAVVGQVKLEDLTCYFDSALVALPALDTDGLWQYDVTVAAKPQANTPNDPEMDLQLKVVKLWKNDNPKTNRPESIQVEIFRNGESYETVSLSEDTHWSYNWTVKDDGASWIVVERNVPKGYTMTVETRENAFVLTNTFTPDTPTPPAPETGDTANFLLYIVLMNVSGIMLIILGIAGKRKRL